MREDLNYLGTLYEIGATQTPFLNAIGGLNKGKTSKAFNFPVAQPYALAGASQPNISENTSVTTATSVTVARGQDYNTVQIFQYPVEVSYAKQSTSGEFGGIQVLGDQPVKDEFDWQKSVALRQMALDLDFTFLQGAYIAAVNATTAARSRGLKVAIDTNEVEAGTVALTKALIDELMRTMAAGGAQFNNMVMLCNAFQKQKVSDIYGYAPEDRMIGGTNVKQIYTDFAPVGVMYAPNMPVDEIYVVDMSVLSPVYCPVDGQLIRFDMLAQTASSKKGQWYAQIGLDYGPEEYHGKITGLTSA